MAQDEGPEGRLPGPITGTEPGPGPSAAKGEQHHDYFNRAIDDAIRQIEEQGWPTPASYDVKLTFEATIEVENPGGVGQYRVTMR